jgi:hypothetical protein
VETSSFQWTLVVPLYHEGEPLNAEAIEVIDLETGELIFSTPIR